MSASQRLAEIEAAITALTLGGAASYTVGGRSVTKFNLPDLYKLRTQLQFEVQRETSSGFSLAKMGRAR